MASPRLVTVLSALALMGCMSEPIRPPQTGRAPVRAQAEPEDWRALLPAQVETVRAATRRYRDFAVARREGWSPFGGAEAEEPLMGTHYYPPEGSGVPDYASGDRIDFAKPNNLIYADIDGETVLTGVAFVVRIGAQDDVPAGFAGPRDQWHVHDFLAVVNAATEERPFLRGLAARWLDDTYFSEGDDRYRLAMVHVWTEHANPDGVFADVDRTLPYRKLGLPARYWQGASVEAARGLHLATRDGCRHTFGGQAWIADASDAQERAVASACIDAATALKTALGPEPAVLNRAAERAWAEYQEAYESVLTPGQRARIAAMTEHGDHGAGGTDQHGEDHHGGHHR